MNNILTKEQIDKRAVYFYVACMAIFAYRFLSNTLFSQLIQPVLINPSIDNTYWLLHLLGIPYFTTHSVIGSAFLDLLLFALPVVVIMTPQRRPFAVLFTILAVIYQVTISTYSMHHYHSLIGLIILSVPFWFEGQRFTMLWQAARYYLFFIFTSAAIWKLCRGSVFVEGDMSTILMSQHAQYLYDYPSAYLAQIRSYLISHPQQSQWLLIGTMLMQLSFAGGFLTRRFDRFYIAMTILFFTANFVVMHIFSFELLILCFALWPDEQAV
jgi:hypothetical protein